jgi:Holliday junction DNA helicase RuvA
MIAQLKGTVIEVNSDHLVMDVNGVGYEVLASVSTLAAMSSGVHTIFIYTHVREDQLVLFGFENKTEKQLFLSLLKVNGIGPKSALAILSGASCEQILAMIEAGDAKALSRLPKLGKKTAEQIVLTLKGKLVLTESASLASRLAPQSTSTQISSALINLGFRPQDVDHVVRGLGSDIDFEEGVRLGLQQLGQQ